MKKTLHSYNISTPAPSCAMIMEYHSMLAQNTQTAAFLVLHLSTVENHEVLLVRMTYDQAEN